MEKSIEELQKELADKIAKLDQERKEASEQHSKEQEERRIIEAAARAEQVKKIKDAEEKQAKRKKEEKESEERRQKEETEARIALEQKQNSLDELIKKQREQMEWLEAEITKTQFVEEQHRKSLETTTSSVSAADSAEVVESVLPGEAAIGTEGSTPATPLMSEHLKRILRQVRNY